MLHSQPEVQNHVYLENILEVMMLKKGCENSEDYSLITLLLKVSLWTYQFDVNLSAVFFLPFC
jgi:hypothetical protein